MKRLLAAALLLGFVTAHAQDAPSPLAPRVIDVLKRSANNHSPTPEEIAEAAHQAAPPDLASALPILLLALDSADTAVRTYSLTVLVALQTPVTAYDPANPPSTPLPFGTLPPSNYKAEDFRLLAPAIPKIAVHLTEDATANRTLAATILGGFSPDPPRAVFPPLYAYLKREDAIGPVGLAVVGDLLGLGPISAETADAVSRFLRRSDQTLDSRANLVDAIASKTNQSPVLNKAVINMLDAEDPSLRARVILSLPQLDLAPDVFSDTQRRVQNLAENPNENLQVINAAKAVAPCWTATKMTTKDCPSYQ